MSTPAYSKVVSDLKAGALAVCELGSGAGPRVAVTLAAGRIAALSFSPDGPNLFWSNPDLADHELTRNHPDKLVGGIGGDRLWFAPELAYHWDGKPDWTDFTNYTVPRESDPGAYEIAQEDLTSVTLQGRGELPVRGKPWRVGFEVERRIRLIEPPLPRDDARLQRVRYAGIETAHVLKIAADTQKGLIDLWHLLQIPAGATLIVPLKSAKRVTPVSYAANPGAWVTHPDRLIWRYSGTAKAKLGLPAAALTGRTAVIHLLAPGLWALIVRQFPVDAGGRYADHPHGLHRTDQAFQAWDGLGFGEMEFHSPAAGAARGPREILESDQLWAFGGSKEDIAALGKLLLGVSVEEAFER